MEGGWMQKRDSSGLSLVPPERSSAVTPAASNILPSATMSSTG